jgi:hypothetical protein
MKKGISIFAMCAFTAVLASAPPALAQGKGNDKGKQGEAKGGGKQDKGPQHKAKGQERGKSDHVQSSGQGQGKSGRDQAASVGRNKNDDHDNGRGNKVKFAGRSGKSYKRVVHVNDLKPDLRVYAVSSRAPERIAAGVLSRGYARGLDDNDIVLRKTGDRVAFLNRSGIVLVDLDDERARNLGNWRVMPYDDDVQDGAPAFCRSGEGHPVWGREWCLNKGFGLGDYRDVRWGRTTDVRDIVFLQQVDRSSLARDVLISVLGDVVFNRLGLHALTLGYSDPLTGVWLGEPTGPRVLRLSSGTVPIAEIYDGDRDNRADALVVALRAW